MSQCTRRMIIKLHQIPAVVAVKYILMCAILSTEIFRVDSLYMSASTAVLCLAAAIDVKCFQDRSKRYTISRYTISTPTFQWVKKNIRYIWKVLVFFSLTFTLLDLAVVICTQRFYGVQNLPSTTRDLSFRIPRRPLIMTAFSTWRIPCKIFRSHKREPRDWEVDILGTSERGPVYLLIDTHRLNEYEIHRYKTSKSSGYQPPAATLRASKVPRKRIVSSITQQPL